MTSGTEPSNLAAPFFVVHPTCAWKKMTRHSQSDDLVEKEEKCEYETFVTDPCACGLGFSEITHYVAKKKTSPRKVFVVAYGRQGRS
jgi:hypothetical protein